MLANKSVTYVSELSVTHVTDCTFAACFSYRVPMRRKNF